MAHLHLEMFTFACCPRVSPVWFSGKADGRVFTSKKVKFAVFSVYRAPPAERPTSLVFACKSTKFAGFTTFTAPAKENAKGYVNKSPTNALRSVFRVSRAERALKTISCHILAF